MSLFLDAEAQPCGPSDAEFVFAGRDWVLNGSEGRLVPFLNPLWSESNTVLHHELEDGVATYYWLGGVSIYSPKTMATVGAALSGNCRVGFSHINNVDFYDYRRVTNKIQRRQEVLDGIDAIKNYPVTQITQDHHMYVSRHELLKLYQYMSKVYTVEMSERFSVAAELLRGASRLDLVNKVSIITHLVYVAVAPIFAVRHLNWIVEQAPDARSYQMTLKLEGQYAKQLQTLFRDDLAAVFELQVLRNRVFDEVDWEAEVDHRTRPATAPINPRTVYKHAVSIFKDAKAAGACQPKQLWEEYWHLRWSHMPVGSVVSQYQEDLDLKKSLPRDARVKAAWFSANKHDNYEYWYNRQPEVYASTSTKYEWGKVRALYGCDVTSFVHSDFAMSECEDMLPPCFPVGSRATSEYVTRMMEGMRDGVPFCYDYDDFNAQHSTVNMQAVVKAWMSVFAPDLGDEQLKSLMWTIDAIAKQRVKYNDLGKTVEINGTLLSGWRLTSFVNTVLNKVYLMEAGIDELASYSLHNGDDVYAITRNVRDAVRIAGNAGRLGVRAQMSKMNIGTIAEFLRVDNRATNPRGAQYLARAVATAVHGRVEIAPANDVRELAKAMHTRMDALIDRGGASNLVNRLRDHCLGFVSQLFQTSWRVLKAFTEYHPLQGGWNEDAPAGLLRLEKIPIGEDAGIRESAFSPIRHGLWQYVRATAKRLKIRAQKSDEELLFKRAVNLLLRKRIRYEIVIERNDKIEVYRGMYKAWAKSRFVTTLAKARSIGLAAVMRLSDIDDSVVRLIQDADRPMEFANAIL